MRPEPSRCGASGRALALESASPSDGYSVDVRERGPEEVEVRFEGGEDDEAQGACGLFRWTARLRSGRRLTLAEQPFALVDQPLPQRCTA